MSYNPNYVSPMPSYGGVNPYSVPLPGPYSRDSYYGGSMRPTNQGQIGPRRNVPGGPTDMPPPPGYEGFQDPLYDPNRPNLQYMPGGPWAVHPRFWNQGMGR